MIRVLVVEDHALVREGLVEALRELQPGAVAVGAAEGNEAMGLLDAEKFDLVLLDLLLPGTRGQTLIGVIRRRFPDLPVVILSAQDDPETVARALSQGAAGFVSKTASTGTLLDALRRVLAGEKYIAQDLREAVSRSAASHLNGKDGDLVQRFGLTPAQGRVFELLVEGGSNSKIAELLGVTEGTVKIHVSAILRALKVDNRAEAVLLAARKRARRP